MHCFSRAPLAATGLAIPVAERCPRSGWCQCLVIVASPSCCSHSQSEADQAAVVVTGQYCFMPSA